MNRHSTTIAMCSAIMTAGIYSYAYEWRNFETKHQFYALNSSDSLTLEELFGAPKFNDFIVVGGDTIRFDFSSAIRPMQLTSRDYEEIAAELGVEVAAIKAVVEIETGRIHKGFNEDGTPIVSFSINVFRTMAKRNNINLTKFTKSHPLVFSGLVISRFGSPQAAEHARVREAMSIDSVSAIQGTFWGMFQIGGFNWKRCGASSPHEFMELMCRSERDQLNLFAAFLRNSDLLKYLKTKNWVAFARGYNGPSYASHKYHTRLAAAYKKFSS